jgi:hypothetical protein
MSRNYEICADEAWTHGGTPLNRYWCFFGGIFGLESDLSKLEAALERIVQKHHHKIEVKWGNISKQSEPVYIELIDEFFSHLATKDIKCRQLFLDRMHVYVPARNETKKSALDTQYRVYYQFLKHHFGLKYLPRAQDSFDTVFIRLDEHSSQQHKAELKAFAEKLPQFLARTDLHFHVSFVESKMHMRMQICDLIMGAAGSHGNKMHLKRRAQARGMTDRQKLKLRIEKYIYEKLKAIVMSQRHSHAFNWFETTGTDGNLESRYIHKIRIWKFIPKNHRIDRGWQNDHLDAHGDYIGPDIVDPPTSEEIF